MNCHRYRKADNSSTTQQSPATPEERMRQRSRIRNGALRYPGSYKSGSARVETRNGRRRGQKQRPEVDFP